jgi:predicted dehydrogenase
MLREESQSTYHIGIIGSGRIANRFVPETKVVNGAQVVAVLNPDKDEAEAFAKKYGIEAYTDFDPFIEKVDVVYIASPHLTHYDYVKQSLLAGKHVLCEIPFTLKKEEAIDLYRLAEERNLVLMEASKTAYCPAFGHIVTLIKSGIIGDVVDVKASLSKMVDPPTRELDAKQAGGAMTEHAPLTVMAIIKLLGLDWKDVDFHTKIENGVDIYTKGVINYPHATSSFTLGIGVKTEGNLVISGTKGYVYVPAPWWLTSYFEVRYEEQTKNKKYFYSYDGEGLRYEIQEFFSMIVNGRRSCYKLRRRESVAIAEIIEKFRNGENVTEI